MATPLSPAAALALVATLSVPAGAQSERCTKVALTVESTPISAEFCVEPGANADSVSVRETLRSGGRALDRTIALSVVAGARTTRTIDNADLAPLGVKRTLHMTLAYRAGIVSLEHALALPGAIPVK